MATVAGWDAHQWPCALEVNPKVRLVNRQHPLLYHRRPPPILCPIALQWWDSLPVHKTTDAPLQLAAVTNSQGQLVVRHVPDGRRPPGPERRELGMGIELGEGSVMNGWNRPNVIFFTNLFGPFGLF